MGLTISEYTTRGQRKSIKKQFEGVVKPRIWQSNVKLQLQKEVTLISVIVNEVSDF